MADIDQIIAGGAGASSRADFSGLSKLLDSYWTGQDQKAKNDLRDAFKEGVPLTPDGQPDFSAMSKTLFQKGGLNEGTAAANLGLAQQNMQFGRQQSGAIQDFDRGGQASQQPLVSPPSANRTASAVVAPPLNKGGVQAPGQTTQGPQGDQPGSIVGLISAAGIPDELAGPVIQQVSALTKMDPNAALDPAISQRVQQVVQAAALRMKGGQQPQPSGLAPQPPPQMAPQPQMAQAPQQPPQMAGQPAPVTNSLTTTQPSAEPSRAEKGIAFFSGIMADPRTSKPNLELAKSRLEALQKSNELTPDQKNYVQYKLEGGKGTMQDFLSEAEAGKAGATERAKGEIKEQQDYIDNGRMAGQRLGTLNTISNIVASDPNLSLGPGSETTLKIKMALEKAGMDFGDLSGSQLIQKLNGVLASESSKQFSTRPTQFEFKTFLNNNPGLALDEKGNVRMLGILSQTAKREVDLGKLARQNRDNWDNWDNVVEAYDKKNPVKDPTTGKILSNSSIIAPGTKPQGAQPAKQGPSPTFGSKADLHAAIASGSLKKGDSFIGGDGVERTVP